ncbi:MAG TPA: amino acid adenylation domain-containing protein, partial [Blastocatellia bacterium]|nr:amino acid adenylation domain-containing protein [Blastocatellia bacterium]
ERSPEMVVGLLGILKAGGAYLPIEPEYPAERIAYMLEDSAAAVLITQAALAERLPYRPQTVICLDSERPAIAHSRADNPGLATSPHNLAYVIYTSGSTGKPKGVLIEHAQVLRLFAATRQWYGFGQEDVWTMLHSYAFDFSVWEIWGALVHGGQVVVVPNEVRRNPEAVYQLLLEKAVTVLNQTPSAFKQLSEVDERRGGSDRLSLRTVIFGGEALEVGSLKGWFERHGDGQPTLVNMYGITETTVHVTYRPIRAEEAKGETPSVIGKQIDDLQFYVLDAGQQPAPVGVSGEAYVGGAGLARGYLRKADLTAARFLPNAYGRQAGERVYRTGDLARYRPDGEVVYMGRADDQVKVRGYRIELGEIESALRDHPAVKECVVVMREFDGGERRLVGYVVSRDAAGASVGELRNHLKQTLPEHMVPAAFVMIDRMPLTQNGKLDRRALPAVESVRPQLESVYAAPRNDIERLLADIWGEVLRLGQVGIHDNYFELGGDSILSIQIVFKASQAGVQLTPRQLFQYQTIAELAAVAGTARLVEAEQSAVEGAVPLTPIQRWFFERDLADAHHYNQARMLEVSADVDAGSLKKAVEELVKHHDALRLRFNQQEDGWQQHNSGQEAAEVFLEIDFIGMAEAERAQAIKDTAARIQASLNLQAGPLMQVALMDLGEDGGKRLLIVIHHLAVDGVSWRILLEDLRRAYEQARQGEIDLGRKRTSYKQWAERLTAYAQGDALKAEADYWIGQQQTDEPRLPLDDEAGENSVESARQVAVWLDEEETRALLQDVPGVYRSQINDVLLTALALAYNEWTGSARVWIDLEGHGREEVVEGIDITRTVGWFTTIYPVTLEAAAGTNPGECIKRVKERLRAVPNKGIGYGLLKYLRAEDEIGSALRQGQGPEIVFNYLGQLGQAAEPAGLFRLARESAGPVCSGRQQRRHVLEVNGGVLGGRLQLNWTYSENLHRRETIERLAGAYKRWLKAIITHCASSEAGGYTPSDFPLAGLSQEQLDQLVGRDRNIEDIYGLSPMQQGLLFHSLYQPEGGAYVVQMSITVEGDVNREEFERMWQGVAEKHEALRAAFLWEGLEEPLQVVRKQVTVPVEYKDWRGLSQAEQQQELERYLREDRKGSFDLRVAPLMRICLIRRGESLYQWVWSHHHLLMDGWSLPLVLGQLSGKSEAAGRARPYRDYIEWLQRQDLGKAESYWREALRGFNEPTQIGIESSGEPVGEFTERYGEVSVRLPKAFTERLEGAAREQRLTLNTLVQGGWALLLSRYSGEKDVVYGATVSGRPAELDGIDKVVGVFINTLPVRVKVSPEQRAGEWLKQLQEQQSEMRQYEYSPLAQVQGWSEMGRGATLFESIFAYENYPMLQSLQKRSGGSKLRDMQAIERTNYPLSVVAVPGEELRIKIIYEKARYAEAAIRRMIKHYENVLESFAQSLAQRVNEIDLLAAEERRYLLEECNDTAAEYPQDRCTAEMVEEQAERAADRVAVVFEDQQLTYAGLNRRANQLAHHLRRQGVGPEVIVGLCVERSPEMVVGLLGILKAGGAYLPLDPQYPMQRLQHMLEDAQVKRLVTTAARAAEFEGDGRQVTRLDADWPQIAEQSAANPVRLGDPRNTAYVIYTSGSTGVPKGAMVEHRGVFNMADAQMRTFGVTANSCTLQFSSLSFDASIFEIVMAQRAGARLCLGTKAGLLPGPGLVELLRRQAVTHITIPPSALSAVPEAPLPALETVIVAGEACSQELAERWRSGRQFFNAYGPTEATVWSSVVEYQGYGAPSIGRPIANVRLHLLDDEYNPVPPGARGEIYIAGDSLARGYIGRAETTAERFVPNAYG